MAAWQNEGACAAEDQRRFFDPADPDEDGKVILDEPALAYCRSFCFECPVRFECLESAMDAEHGAREMYRFGIWGGMTVHQRASLWRRGPDSWRCQDCGQVYDPTELMSGMQVCGCASRVSAPISDRGDQWADRHTTLARTVRDWVIDTFEPGDDVPSPTRYARERGIRKDDCTRVWKALREDGVLEQVARGRYVRLPGSGALRLRGRSARRRGAAGSAAA